MRIDVVTLFPQMVETLAGWGIVGRAVTDGLVRLGTWNPRDFATDRHRSVDDRPYGGGPGMVMMVQPLRDAIRAARAAGDGSRVIYLSPQGRPFDQARARALSGEGRDLVLVAGRYEGIDERVLETEIDEELSIGDYVMSGGELAALVVIDAVTRLLPGALGDEESARQDSFMDGLLDYAHYTRPRELDGLAVPEVLLSGDHAAIEEWRRRQALARTWRKRPDLLGRVELGKRQRAWLKEIGAELEEHDRESDGD